MGVQPAQGVWVTSTAVRQQLLVPLSLCSLLQVEIHANRTTNNMGSRHTARFTLKV